MHNKTSLHTLALIVLSGMLMVGCGPRDRTIQIVPAPADAEVSVDGNLLGVGVSEYALAGSDGNQHTLKVCGPNGYFCAEGVIDHQTRDTLEVVVPRDEGWFQTVEDERVATWVVLGERNAEEMDTAWKDLVTRFPPATIEVIDPASFYLRTQWKVVGADGAPTRIRSRMAVGLGSAGEGKVTLRMKIETEQIDQSDQVVGKPKRTLPEFIEVLEEARTL